MIRMRSAAGRALAGTALLAVLMASAATVEAQALRLGLGGTSLGANDDGSTGLIAFGFTFNLFGLSRTSAYVNNNGNITFDAALGTFTPFPLLSTPRQMLAPFFADVDTRSSPLSGLTTYGSTSIGGNAAFHVDWFDVDYFSATSSPHGGGRNDFQLVMIDRSIDLGAGNFDFEFNYGRIQWEAGQASGSDSFGLGGSCARMGWTNGSTHPTPMAYEQAGSGVCGDFLDGGPNALISHRLNSDRDGRYVWNVREGVISGTVPEPSTYFLFGTGLLGIIGVSRRRRSA